jgi:predicted DNA-binding transcriptional regulator AlpA
VHEIFVAFPELRSHGIPYCRLHVNRLIARNLFPAAVWLSANRKVWRLSDIERWKASRPEARPVADCDARPADEAA